MPKAPHNSYPGFSPIIVALPVLLLFAQIVAATPSTPALLSLPPLNDSDSGESISGKFIWYDLATTELEKQQAFYGEVFDWTFRTIADAEDRYTLILNKDRAIAGMFSVPAQEQTPVSALWLGLMSNSDPDNAAALAQQHGGAIHTPPKTLAQRGTFAILRDPEGALFGVLKSTSGDPPDRNLDVGDFLWVDLFAKHPNKSSRFYRQLAGYDINHTAVKDGAERIILNSKGKPRAGIVPLPENANRAGWLPYVKVADIESTLKKVSRAGGHVMVPPSDDLLAGNLAIFTDPQGGILGVVKWENKAESSETDNATEKE